MKNLAIFFTIGLVVFCMSGCAKTTAPSQYAIKGYTSKAGWSEARNVINAAGLRDIRDKKPEKLGIGSVYGGEKGRAIGATSFTALQYFSDLNRLGLGTIPLSIMSWNAVGSRDERAYPKLYAWMPRSNATDPDQAIEVLNDVIKEALGKALAEVVFPAPYETENYYSDENPVGYKVSGGLCSEGECRYNFVFGRKFEGKENLPYPGVSPDFLGAGESWVFSKHAVFRPCRTSRWNQDGRRAALPDLQVFQAMTKYLPNWVYLYLPNSTKSKRVLLGEGNNALGFLVVLNQGNTLLFVKPNREESFPFASLPSKRGVDL